MGSGLEELGIVDDDVGAVQAETNPVVERTADGDVAESSESDLAEVLQVVQGNHLECGPLILRLESGPELPLAGLPAGGDEPNITIICVLSPFVFLHRRT